MNRIFALIVAVTLGTWLEVNTWIKWVLHHRGKITYYEYRRFDDLAEDYQS